MSSILEEQIVQSALWAAYGDILGFPTELISEAEFSKRFDSSRLVQPVAWTKRIGGLFGPEITFPAGSYSDDTQLRLSVCRAIRGDGFFDVESFAKIELPVWQNYALGAGRSSKLAASNLASRDTSWSHNFFHDSKVKYWEGGGNGAVMRIHPHVWANHSKSPSSFIPDIIRDAVCTHGHPRAILGALIYGQVLFLTLRNAKPLHPKTWASLGEEVARAGIKHLLADQELSLVWVPHWEQCSGQDLRNAWAKTASEWVNAAERVSHICETDSNPEECYRKMLHEFGGYSSTERGSGLKTPLYAMALTWLYQKHPEEGLLTAIHELKSDTDTIATLAGGLMGAFTSSPPAGTIQDRSYIEIEARRLFAIGAGKKQPSFDYPDLNSWAAPRTQSDAWTEGNDGVGELTGLGKLKPISKSFTNEKRDEIVWQWCQLPFGQTILAKRRAKDIKQAKPDQRPTGDYTPSRLQASLFSERTAPSSDRQPTLDEITQHCIKQGFDPLLLGESLLSLCNAKDGIEKAIAFASIIAKARIARSK